MPQQRGDDLDRDAVTQPPGRRTVTEPVRVERDPGPGPEPQDEVIGRLIRPRVSSGLRPDVHEDMVAADIAVLFGLLCEFCDRVTQGEGSRVCGAAGSL